MIYGIILLDDSGFTILETFTSEFFNLNFKKSHIFTALAKYRPDLSSIEIKELKLLFNRVGSKYAIGILTDSSSNINVNVINQLISLSIKSIEGDSAAIHKMMGFRRSKEIEYL